MSERDTMQSPAWYVGGLLYTERQGWIKTEQVVYYLFTNNSVKKIRINLIKNTDNHIIIKEGCDNYVKKI